MKSRCSGRARSFRFERTGAVSVDSFFLHKPVRLEDIGQIVVGLLEA
jgi:hypothetical protein